MDAVAYLLFVLTALSAAGILAQELARRGGYVNLPFLIALLYLIWLLPQALPLLDDPTMRAQSTARMLLMALLCLWALRFGWGRGMRGAPEQFQPLNLSLERLTVPVAAITAFAWTMQIMIGARPAEELANSQWSGPLTILAFFASVGKISMALSMAMVLVRRNLAALLIFAANFALYAPALFVSFRRAATFDVALAFALALLFLRGRALSRGAILAAGLVGFFFVNGVGHLRALGQSYEIGPSGRIEARMPTLQEIADIDWLSVADSPEAGAQTEVRNAALYMEAASAANVLSLGAQYTDKLVHAYVPGQIIGHDLKRALQFAPKPSDVAYEVFGYDTLTGQTQTGLTDVFFDFWYFGCGVWWLTGFAMGRLMRNTQRGDAFCYALYAATITLAAHVVTHYGYYLFTQSLLILLTVILIRRRLVPGAARLRRMRPGRRYRAAFS